MSARAFPRTALLVAGLLLAWLGVWGTWLAHPTAALTQAALDLARAAQRLPDVLYGQLGGMPDLLRASVGLMAVALGVAAARVEVGWGRWLLRALALVLALRLLPPYPYVLALWRSPDYGRRFVVAALTLAGWAAALTGGHWRDLWHALVTLGLALAALVTGVWAFLVLRGSFVAATRLSFSPGWGLALYVVGLLLAVVLSWLNCLTLLRPEGASLRSGGSA